MVCNLRRNECYTFRLANKGAPSVETADEQRQKDAAENVFHND